jgi:hypothetical protein
MSLQLPLEVWQQIGLHLPIDELMRLRQLSHTWKAVSEQAKCWEDVDLSLLRPYFHPKGLQLLAPFLVAVVRLSIADASGRLLSDSLVVLLALGAYSLKTLTLRCAPTLNVLPTMPSLTVLDIDRCGALSDSVIQKLPSLTPALTSLSLSNLDNDLVRMARNVEWKMLQSLQLSHLPNLSEGTLTEILTALGGSLERLVLIALPSVNVRRRVQQPRIPPMLRLRHLHVHDCIHAECMYFFAFVPLPTAAQDQGQNHPYGEHESDEHVAGLSYLHFGLVGTAHQLQDGRSLGSLVAWHASGLRELRLQGPFFDVDYILESLLTRQALLHLDVLSMDGLSLTVEHARLLRQLLQVAMPKKELRLVRVTSQLPMMVWKEILPTASSGSGVLFPPAIEFSWSSIAEILTADTTVPLHHLHVSSSLGMQALQGLDYRQLTELSLSNAMDNSLTPAMVVDILQQCLGTLQRLTLTHFSNFRLPTLFAGVSGQLHRLTYLNLSFLPSDTLCPANCQILTEYCPNIQRIIAAGRASAQLSDGGLLILSAAWPQLRELSCDAPGVDLTIVGLSALAEGCRNLQTLQLTSSAGIDWELGIAVVAANCLELRTLYLSDCNSVTDRAIAPLFHSCHALELLSVHRCTQLSNDITTRLERGRALTVHRRSEMSN